MSDATYLAAEARARVEIDRQLTVTMVSGASAPPV